MCMFVKCSFSQLVFASEDPVVVSVLLQLCGAAVVRGLNRPQTRNMNTARGTSHESKDVEPRHGALANGCAFEVSAFQANGLFKAEIPWQRHSQDMF